MVSTSILYAGNVLPPTNAAIHARELRKFTCCIYSGVESRIKSMMVSLIVIDRQLIGGRGALLKTLLALPQLRASRRSKSSAGIGVVLCAGREILARSTSRCLRVVSLCLSTKYSQLARLFTKTMLLVVLRIRIIDGSPSYAEINTQRKRKAQLVFNEVFFPSLLLLKDKFLVFSCFQETATATTAISISCGNINYPSIGKR